jgi:hypothetical protein
VNKRACYLSLCTLAWLVGCSNSDDEASQSAGSVPSIAPTPSAEADGESSTGSGSAAPAGPALPGAAASAPSASGSAMGVSTSTSTAAAPPVAAGAPATGTAASVPGAPIVAVPPPVLPPSTTPTPNPRPIPPGTSGVLTAGTWDDNRNFDRFKHYRGELAQLNMPGLLPTTDDEHASAHGEFSQIHGARETLDIALVIDTTGSMGDEIRYLQSEFLALSSAIEAKYPNSTQRWSLVVYRDVGDDYVTQSYDFREDAADFRSKLALQSAGGGGDFPEAPDAALAAMAQLSWRTDQNTARLAFWVADAPHHDDKAPAMLAALRAARSIDVHIYPVASSGINELTELTMRSAAQLTGGRYLFLTDDSGIGGSHKEPTIPCYFVTQLDNAILRMVDIELSGEYHEPAADEIIRTGGNPQDGACKLESGDSVLVF